MPIVNFHITGSPDRLQITLTARDNSNGRLLPGTRQYTCPLPPLSSQLQEKDRQWKRKYADWLRGIATLTPSSPPIEIETNVSVLQECQQLGNELIREFNLWIGHATRIQNALLHAVSSQVYCQNPGDFCFVLNADTIDPALNLTLQRLPFHAWDFFQEYYPHAEISLSTTSHALSPVINQRLQVLVVRGYDPNINLAEQHVAIGRQLADSNLADVMYWDAGAKENATVNLFKTLKNSSPKVLFFVGHSESTHGATRIYLNDREYINLQDGNFRNILKGLKNRGLIFAAFISCDGLGIAKELSDLGIPYLMVSREILPVHVAKEFLDEFLAKATEPGVPIHIALSHARQHLHEIVEACKTMNGCPNASNFPVIFQFPEQHSYILNPIPTPEPKIVSTEQISQQEIQISTNKNYQKAAIISASLLIASVLCWVAWKMSNYTVPESIINNPDISLGDKPLIEYGAKEDIGFDDFKNGRYQSAIEKFNKYQSTKSTNRYSPEISIAINNSKVVQKAKESGRKPILIGIGVPLINNIPVAREMLAGIAMYQKEANEKGAMLQIAIGRDGNDADSAKKIAQAFVDEPAILAAIGHNASEASVPAAEIYSDKLVMLSPTSFDPQLSGRRYIYRMVSQMASFAGKLQNHIGKSFKALDQVPRLAICLDPQSPDNEAFKKVVTTLATSYDIKHTDLQCGKFKDLDDAKTRDLIRKVRESNSNAILIAPHINSIDKTMKFIKAVRTEPGLANIKLFGSPSFYTSAAENAGVETDGLTIPVPYFPNPQNLFVREYYKEWDRKLNNWRTPMSYASARIITEKLQRNPNRLELNTQLSNEKKFSPGVIDPFDFNEANELDYANQSSPAVLIKLEDQKFALIK